MGFITATANAQAPATPAEAAQTKFQVRKLRLSGKTIPVEIADTEALRSQGLMFREKLSDDHGMLFIFEEEQPLGFWMKNTLIPLSIGFFDKDKALIRVYEMVPAVAGEVAPRTYNSVRPASFALEMPKGWFAHNKIESGAHFTFFDKH